MSRPRKIGLGVFTKPRMVSAGYQRALQTDNVCIMDSRVLSHQFTFVDHLGRYGVSRQPQIRLDFSFSVTPSTSLVV
jgi:hypothetical protein